jgi:hypothetical protein
MPDLEKAREYDSAEYAIDCLAVMVLCDPAGCQTDKDCPFDPMCAADLTIDSQVRAIMDKFAALEAALKAEREQREKAEWVARELADRACGVKWADWHDLYIGEDVDAIIEWEGEQYAAAHPSPTTPEVGA